MESSCLAYLLTLLTNMLIFRSHYTYSAEDAVIGVKCSAACLPALLPALARRRTPIRQAHLLGQVVGENLDYFIKPHSQSLFSL